MLCAGAPQQLKDKLKLGKPDDYRVSLTKYHFYEYCSILSNSNSLILHLFPFFKYLSGCTQYFATASTDRKIAASSKSGHHQAKGPLKDPILDDYDDFNKLDQALTRLGMNDSIKLQIYALVAAVLHLGNVTFEENPDDVRGGCQVSEKSKRSLEITSELIGVDIFELRTALVSRVMQSKGGGIKGTVIM